MIAATVVIPTYNRPDHLRAALDALAKQAEPDAPFAVVVADDGSQPPIALGAAWPFPVGVARLPENRGRAAARNAALAAVETPLVIFIDDDIRPEAGFVRAFVRAIDPGGREVGIGATRFHPDIPRDRLTRYLETRGVAKLDAGSPIPFRYFLTYNSGAPTELLRRAGGFDERLRGWGGEDIEIAYRLAGQGARFVRVPGARALHAHRRDIDALWDVSVGFARDSMPVLFAAHPPLVHDLRADVLGPARWASSRAFTRIAIRAATGGPLPRIVRAMLRRWPGAPWPMRLYDYFIAAAWRRGLDAAEEVRP